MVFAMIIQITCIVPSIGMTVVDLLVSILMSVQIADVKQNILMVSIIHWLEMAFATILQTMQNATLMVVTAAAIVS